MFKSEIIFKHRFRWLVQLWLKRRNEKKEKCFSRHELPLNEKNRKITRFSACSHCCSQPVSTTLCSWGLSFARLYTIDVFTRLEQFLTRIVAPPLLFLNFSLGRLNLPPPSPSPFREEYTPPKMATTRVALKKDLHVWSLLPSSFRSWDSSRFEIKQKSGMNERLDEDFRIDISYLEKFSRGN